MMGQVLLLFRLRLYALAASLFKGSKRKASGTASLLLMALVFGLVFVSFGFSFFSVFAVMREASGLMGAPLPLYLSFAAALTLALCLFGSTFTAQSQLYQARDTELLLAMPLSPAAIFSSRLLLLVALNLLYGSVAALPAFIVYCLYDFTVGGARLFVLFFTLIVFVSLAISCLLGWLIALVSSRIKRKNLVTILFSLAFLALYFLAFSSLNSFLDEMNANILGFASVAAPFLAIFAPVGAAIFGTDLLSPILFAAISLLVIAVVAILLIRTYVGILTANRGGVQYVYREKQAKEGSPLIALMRKEFFRFLGSPMYMMNAGLGLIMAPIAGVLILVGKGEILSFFAEPTPPALILLLPISIACAGVFLNSTIFISAPSISLEAKNLWLLQSMPVSARTVLLAKTYFHILMCAPFFLVFSVLAAIALGVGPLDFLILLLLPQAAAVFSAFFGTTVGFLLPKFDWTNEVAAVKSSACSGLSMLGMMLVSLVTGTFCLLPTILWGVPLFIGPFAMIALLLAASVGLFAYLCSSAAERRFAALQP